MAEEFMTDDEQFEAAKQWLASNGLFLVGGAVLAAVVAPNVAPATTEATFDVLPLVIMYSRPR